MSSTAELQRQPAPAPARAPAPALAIDNASTAFDPATAPDTVARFGHRLGDLDAGPMDGELERDGDRPIDSDADTGPANSSARAETEGLNGDHRNSAGGSLLERSSRRNGLTPDARETDDSASGPASDRGRESATGLQHLDRGTDASGQPGRTPEATPEATPADRRFLGFGGPQRPGAAVGRTLGAQIGGQTSQTGTGGSSGGVGSPMGSSANVRPATPAENREFVDIAVEFIQHGRDRYLPAVAGIDATTRQPILRTPPVDRDQLIRQLDGWKATIEGCLRIIRESLHGDAALDQTVRQTYRDAVEAAVSAAAQHQSRSRHDLYDEQRERILDWAWPQASQDPHGNDLSEMLTPQERGRIRFVTTGISLQSVDAYFAQNAAPIALPANTGVRFGGSIPPPLQAGLQRIAATIAGLQDGLALNTTLTLGLDLGRVGGDYAAYRFTHVEHPAQGRGNPATREILVEHLGNIGSERMRPDEATEQRARFGRLNLRLGSGWGAAPNWDTNPELQALLSGLAGIPDGDLARVPGLTIDRAGVSAVDANRSGEYNAANHTISLFNNAFSTSLTRFGTPGARFSDDTSLTIRHEVGHALDEVALKAALASSNTANARLTAQAARQRAEFGDVFTPPNQFRIPPDRQPAWDQLQRDIAAARLARDTAVTARDRTRSLSGGQFEQRPNNILEVTQGPAVIGTNAFRQAAQQDGVRATRYSDQSWLEYFAEAYALFRSAPDDLRRLRPHVFAFMQTTFP